jgi:hypothetical protein
MSRCCCFYSLKHLVQNGSRHLVTKFSVPRAAFDKHTSVHAENLISFAKNIPFFPQTRLSRFFLHMLRH